MKSRLLPRLLVISFFAVVGLAVSEPARPVTTQDLATLRDIEGLSISPDGAWAAFQIRQADPENNRYAMTWHVVALDGRVGLHRAADAGEPIPVEYLGRITNGVGPVVAPSWSPDNEWIAYLRQDQGRVQVWRSHRDGGEAEQLTRKESDPSRLAYSRDGTRLFFETKPSRAQIHAALELEGRAGFLYDRRFMPSYSRWPTLPADVDFDVRNISSTVGAQLSTPGQLAVRRIWTYEFATKEERPATEAERMEFAALINAPKPINRPDFRGLATKSPAGGLAWVEARDSTLQGASPPLTIVAQPSGVAVPVACSVPEGTGQSIKGLWWRNDDELIFARGEGARYHHTAIYSWKPRQGDLRLILRTSEKFVSRGEWVCSIARDRLVGLSEDGNSPRRLVSLDLDTGVSATLYEPNPEYARLTMSEPREILIRTASGLETYGYLVLPPDHKAGERLPLIIVTYRASGFLRGGSGDEYPVYPFAAQGFAVLCFTTPDYDAKRMLRMSSADYLTWSRGPGDPEKHEIQEALDAAVAQLDQMGLIDPKRVGLTGLSFGAETTAHALYSMRHLSAAIASGVGGVYEPMYYYLMGAAAQETHLTWGFGQPDGPTAGRWRAMALSANVERVHAPFLLNVADHEMLSALQPVITLQNVGKPVEMFVYPDEYHVKWQPAHRLAIYNRNIDWLNFWLQGKEDPDPAKADQYIRWRKLRELHDADMKKAEMEKQSDKSPAP